jgi:hypothetical protein
MSSAQHPVSHIIEEVILRAMVRKGNPMFIDPRAANQVRALDPAHVAGILDRESDLEVGKGRHVVEVTTGRSIYQCSIAGHRDGSLVLVSVEVAS